MEGLKFTKNPVINEKVTEIIELLKNELIYHFNPKSIILTGSFARQEATIIEEDGKLKFLSDCEIIIISNQDVFGKKKKKFTSQFYKRTGLKVSLSGTILMFNLYLPFLRKNMEARIDYYDLKYGSKVIYGKDYLKELPDFNPEEIPPWEGIRLILNRMAESIEHLSFEKPGRDAVYWTDKMILACQDALLLNKGKYHSSFVERNKMFQSCYNSFKEIDSAKVLSLSQKATERKLNWFDESNPLEYWSKVAKVSDMAFRYIVKEDMGFDFTDYTDFQSKYLDYERVKKHTHKPLSNPLFVNTVNLIKAFLCSQDIPFKMLREEIGVPWEQIAYSKIPSLYFQLKNDERAQILKLWRATSF